MRGEVVHSYKPNYFAFLLIGTFIFAFALGTTGVSCESDLYSTLIYNAARQSITLRGVLFLVFVPFAITTLIYCSGRRYLFLPLCFIQAFLFGICSNAIYFSYGNAHWLISLLVLFTSTIALSSLLWFWFRHSSVQRATDSRDLLICFIISALAACLDNYVVSPFLVRLFI